VWGGGAAMRLAVVRFIDALLLPSGDMHLVISGGLLLERVMFLAQANLETPQGQTDGGFSQLPFKCHSQR